MAHGVDAFDGLCAQFTRDLFSKAKFLFSFSSSLCTFGVQLQCTHNSVFLLHSTFSCWLHVYFSWQINSAAAVTQRAITVACSINLVTNLQQKYNTLQCGYLPNRRSFSSRLASRLSLRSCFSISWLILFCSCASSLMQQAIAGQPHRWVAAECSIAISWCFQTANFCIFDNQRVPPPVFGRVLDWAEVAVYRRSLVVNLYNSQLTL